MVDDRWFGAGIALASLGLGAAPAQGQDLFDLLDRVDREKIYLRAGATYFSFDDESRIQTARLIGDEFITPFLPLNDAGVRIDNSTTASFEIGYFIMPDLSIAVTAGYPPSSDVVGTGMLDSAGRLGSISYGPPAIDARYHLPEWRRFQLYVGATVSVVAILDEASEAFESFEVEDALVFGVTTGLDVRLTDHFGVFADVKKIDYQSSAKFELPRPSNPDRPRTIGRNTIELNPIVTTLGLSYRF